MRMFGFWLLASMLVSLQMVSGGEFGVVLNSPPLEQIDESMLTDENMQINVFEGGRVIARDAIRKAGGPSEINIGGGVVEVRGFGPDTVVNMSGGRLQSRSSRNGVSVAGDLNVSGGEISGIVAGPESNVSISGGTFESLIASNESSISLIAEQFLLGGELLELPLGTSIEVTTRDVELSGRFSNGSLFEFPLNSDLQAEDFSFPVDATLTVTLVPEPTGLASALVLTIGVMLVPLRCQSRSP